METFDQTFPKIEMPKNIVEIKTEDANFRIIYGIHTTETDPKTIENTDGVILEMIGDYSTLEKNQKHINFIPRQYRRIIKACREAHRPVFLIDLYSEHLRSSNRRVSFLKNVLLPSLESTLGLSFAGFVIKDVLSNPKMTRKIFLRLVLKLY
ncbi:hypothetical protein HY061_02050 [Candidatus Azambacteria bacterium]|nr:hypothetical protein [Candidatus Azambacteria bacterium]